jgi:subtilisin family serine protease
MNQFWKIALPSLLLTCFTFSVQAQGNSRKAAPDGWHLLDNTQDGYPGISLNKAYEFLRSQKLKSKQIVVAVIDSGIDTLHEDLTGVLWVNAKEIPGNSIDDDNNGYVDDVNGWNFIGGKDGRNVKEDSYEMTRVYHKYKNRFKGLINPDTLSTADKEIYEMWEKARTKTEGNAEEQVDLPMMKRVLASLQKNDSILRQEMNKKSFTGTELGEYIPTTDAGKRAKNAFYYLIKNNNALSSTNEEFLNGFNDFVKEEERKAAAVDKEPVDLRKEIVKDNEEDFNDRFYGNNDIMASTPMHGTHVSGIIAAQRGNNKGVDGIADNVRIMTIRAVPDGDEHDKDIALAIRYAVDNGAKVVNMSFGKSFSPQKYWVDEAVKYAESKGVLLVHAAGNDGANIDTVDNFPNATLKTLNARANNWITVGASASGDVRSSSLTAFFSNYGKKEVDVFAPGFRIYSTLPGGDTYGNLDGTSMAAPVVAGIAALTLSYFPELTPQQLKMVIETSAQAPGLNVKTPGTGATTPMSELSKTGGLVNAFEAVKLAASLNKTAKPKSVIAPKPVLKKGKKG